MYLSDLVTKLTDEASQVLDEFSDKWDFDNVENPNYEEAVWREADREVWRTWYKKISNLKHINTALLDRSQGGPISGWRTCWWNHQIWMTSQRS